MTRIPRPAAVLSVMADKQIPLNEYGVPEPGEELNGVPERLKKLDQQSEAQESC